MPSDQPYNALEQLRGVVADTASHISDFTSNPSDFTRRRKLPADILLSITLNMQAQSLNTELINAFPTMEDRATASAYEQQKAKLTPEVFQYLLQQYNQTAYPKRLYNGKYELYAIDGSSFNPPYQSKSKYVMPIQTGRPRKGGQPYKPYSLLHGNLLYNITDRIYQDVIIQPRLQMNERDAAIEMLDRLHPKNPYIVIMDRGYDGFNMIEHGNRLNGDGYYVLRTKTGDGGISEIAELPDQECDMELDFLVTTSGNFYFQNRNERKVHLINAHKTHYKETFSPNTRNRRWDFAPIQHVKCRVCKFRINDPDTGREVWEVLLTNLNRFEFPLQKMKDLYHYRWDIETSFRELKYALGAVQFHSRKDSFVEMELLAHLIMFNVVSRTINAVKVPQSADNKHPRVISFKDAVTLVRKYFRLHNTDPPEKIYVELLGYTRSLVNGRKDKRNMKPKSAIWFVYRVA